MEHIVTGMNRFFDFLWAPLSRSPWYIDLIIISAISAFIFLIIFKKTSNQKMIRRYKDKIFARILEIRLYKDQPILTLKIFFSILGHNLIYLKYTFKPLIVIFPFILIISIQLNNRYGYSPIAPEHPFIIRAVLDRKAADNLESVQLETSDGITIETSPMRIFADASIFWRAKAIGSKNNYQFCRMRIEGRSDTLERKIITQKNGDRFSPGRSKWRLNSLLTNNAEDFIPKSSSFKEIIISYERADYPFLRWRAGPIVIYFILTVIFGLAFKPFLGVNL